MRACTHISEGSLAKVSLDTGLNLTSVSFVTALPLLHWLEIAGADTHIQC
jgi:hypothetical protein